MFPRQFQAVGQPAIGATEVGVAVSAPLHDQRAGALFDGISPDVAPLRLAEAGIDVQRLIENPLVSMGHRAAKQQAHNQKEMPHQKFNSTPKSTPLPPSYKLPPNDCWYSVRTDR
ncbi:hypothetical protein D3C86_1732390 [compost metagenome]